MYKYDVIAFEPIQNNSICVYVEESGLVRNMKYSEDIGELLVFVSNIPKVDQVENFVINTGDLVRCFPINISRKIVGVEDFV